MIIGYDTYINSWTSNLSNNFKNEMHLRPLVSISKSYKSLKADDFNKTTYKILVVEEECENCIKYFW